MSQFWSKQVHELTPYVPGEQPKVKNLIKLNTNESPYPPSPAVREALAQFDYADLRLYPDPNCDQLKDALAETYQLKRQNIFVGNGSDEVLAHVFAGLLKQDRPILYPDITYSFYPVYCELFQVDYQSIPLNEQFEIEIEDYSVENGGIIFPNPNAPTGRLVTLDKIKQLLVRHPNSLVVMDEAYIDFGGESAVSLIQDHPNLLVVQTFSKSRALAGSRVGYAMGHPDLIEGLERVKNSFNSYPLDRPAIEAACAALSDPAYFSETCQRIIDTRENLTQFLTQQGFEVIPSHANFVFAKHPNKPAEWLAQQLRDQAIIVRYFNKPRINEYLRITIGNEAENQALCKALETILVS